MNQSLQQKPKQYDFTMRDLPEASQQLEQEALKINQAIKLMSEQDHLDNSVKVRRHRPDSSVGGVYGLSERDNWLLPAGEQMQ